MIKLIQGVNDLKTVYPDIAAEWHPTRNDGLLPSEIHSGSNKTVWWQGKCGHEWEASPNTRLHNGKKLGCPYCSNHRVLSGFNDLATINPALAREWHPTKNGELTPNNIVAGSPRKVWWLCPYDDPVTGKHFDFEWQATITSRNKGTGCPFITGNAVWTGFNDLATSFPQIAKEWHEHEGEAEMRMRELSADWFRGTRSNLPLN